MQGTGVVTLAALLAGVRVNGQRLQDQRIVVFGGGTAGTGISDQIVDALQREGLSLDEARKRFWMLDRPGLLTTDMLELTKFQAVYARNPTELADWQLTQSHGVNLADVVQNVKPTILIGCSAVAGAFTQAIITNMASYQDKPIILPLSNPTERAEATPADILAWTQGRALLATGSPFDNLIFNDVELRIAQCNNAFVFPGLGLGLIAVQARRLTDDTLWAACEALVEASPALKNPLAPLLPSLNEARQVAKIIALAVAKQVLHEGLADFIPPGDLASYIETYMWKPHYIPMIRRPR